MNKILYEDFPKICRLCLGSAPDQPIIKVKDLHILNVITNINVKEDDKLPENVCDNCIKQLEDISAFIATCENNDQTLKQMALNEYEKSLEKFTDSCDSSRDSEPCDELDLKQEQDSDNYSEIDIKEEYIIEPNFEETQNVDSPISCENCNESFPNIQGLSEHYREIVICRPSNYDEDSSNVPNFVDHPKINDNEGSELFNGRPLKGKRRFPCSYCGKWYTRKNGLERHVLSHTGERPFECQECGKRYMTKDTLKIHLLTHTGVKPYKCTICEKTFRQSSHLNHHMTQHTGEKPFCCTFCGKRFALNYSFERHKLIHTGKKKKRVNEKNNKPKAVDTV